MLCNRPLTPVLTIVPAAAMFADVGIAAEASNLVSSVDFESYKLDANQQPKCQTDFTFMSQLLSSKITDLQDGVTEENIQAQSKGPSYYDRRIFVTARRRRESAM